MITKFITPTRGSGGGHENHQGVLTDASSRVNRQRTKSLTTKPQYQYHYQHYFSSDHSSQSPHRRLRRNTSTRALRSIARYHQTRANRSPYDTSPHTPSKLSQVMIAEYDLAIADTPDIDTPPLTMPTKLALNKKLPPKPIFRLEDSPERRGLLDATDLNSSLQFPILQPKSAVKEVPVTELNSTKLVAEDLTFVVPSISNNSDADSDFEVGIAQIGTAYDASTISEVTPLSTNANMASPPIRHTNSSAKRREFNHAKFAITPSSSKAESFNLNVPTGGNRRTTSHGHIASPQNDGSPLPKKDRRGRSSLGNGEGNSLMSTDKVISHFSADRVSMEADEEPLVEINHSSNGPTDTSTQVTVDGTALVTDHENITQSASTQVTVHATTLDTDQDNITQSATEDVIDGPSPVTDQENITQSATEDVIDGPSPVTDQEDVTQGAIHSAVRAIAQSGTMGRSESQTTLGRQKKMVPPPSKRFARDADRTILGTSPSYSKVTTRVYMEDTIEEELPHVGHQAMTQKVSTAKPKGFKRVLTPRAGGSKTQADNNAAHSSDETNAAETKFARRKSSLPDSPENQTLKPLSLTVEKKRQSFTERLSKPTASSAARAKSHKSAPLAKSTTMTSVKNAGKGLKSRISGMMRTRRTSESVGTMDIAGPSFDNVPKDAATQHDIPVQTLEKVPELAPLVSEGDVSEEFAAFYSQMEYSSEKTAPAEQLTSAIEPTVNNSNGESGLISPQVIEASQEMINSPASVEESSPMSEAETNAIVEASPVSQSEIADRIQKLAIQDVSTPGLPLPTQGNARVQQIGGNTPSLDVQVAAGDGASDPPPNQAGNGGHADEVVPPPTPDEMLTELHLELAELRIALLAESDTSRRIVLGGYCVRLTNKIEAINKNRQLMLLLQIADESMIAEGSLVALNCMRFRNMMARDVSNN
ncbi:hypothetical protein SBOR_0621 [Sclerotinia borealis F-4128]|uniref:Uncharacterized protein n=1 Tax=Sclerotinia borealis (strain F-4128) TaxID=1432307 RepID=W9CS74_SCLBF|nr:hypothetical protein SBOR_0621 [Sclerotinia borealis F-4128]